jgi:hypothetical protein
MTWGWVKMLNRHLIKSAAIHKSTQTNNYDKLAICGNIPFVILQRALPKS